MKRHFNQKPIEFHDQGQAPRITLTLNEMVNTITYPHKSKDRKEMKVKNQFFTQQRLILEMDVENEN